jgi:hypothetical protein
MDRAGQAITFRSVSRAAGVSRSFIYRHKGLRAEIERLRQASLSPHPLPSALRSTERSRLARDEALRAEIDRLAEENRLLRRQAETLLGERRAAAPE